MDTTIRSAREDEAPLVASFNRAMALETEGRALEEGTSERGAAAVLADPSLGTYLVAESGGEVQGALLLTDEWSDWRDGRFWWIQSVYVRPEARGKGVFRALYAEVLRRARATRGVCGVRLYVEAENRRARAVYRALGMAESSYRIYELDFVLGPDGPLGAVPPHGR